MERAISLYLISSSLLGQAFELTLKNINCWSSLIEEDNFCFHATPPIKIDCVLFLSKPEAVQEIVTVETKT